MRVQAPSTRGSGAAAGFTLVELLVAVSLAGLVMVLLFGGFRFGARAWEAGGARVDQAAEIALVQGFLRRRIGEAVPVTAPSNDGRRAVVFEGGSSELAFVTLMPVHLGIGGYSVLRLRRSLEDGEGVLLLGWSPYRFDGETAIDDAGDGLGDERVLLRGVGQVTFEYFGAEDPRDPPSWRSEWRDAERPPRLVRMALDFERDRPRLWPELTVALSVTRGLGRGR